VLPSVLHTNSAVMSPMQELHDRILDSLGQLEQYAYDLDDLVVAMRGSLRLKSLKVYAHSGLPHNRSAASRNDVESLHVGEAIVNTQRTETEALSAAESTFSEEESSADGEDTQSGTAAEPEQQSSAECTTSDEQQPTVESITSEEEPGADGKDTQGGITEEPEQQSTVESTSSEEEPSAEEESEQDLIRQITKSAGALEKFLSKYHHWDLYDREQALRVHKQLLVYLFAHRHRAGLPVIADQVRCSLSSCSAYSETLDD
jgi:hypothetical protein